MNFKVENGVLNIDVAGRIDTNNANQVQEELEKIRTENPADAIVLNMEDMDYISSAGLRVVLKVKKVCSDFKIINVPPVVYEVFETTGFTEMIDIQKGYRNITLDGCEKIGEGSNGIVYRLDDEIIVKLYKNHDALNEIKRERDLARAAFVAGIPTAIPFDIIRCNGLYGSVFELLNAKSITKLLKANPDDATIDTCADTFVNLLKEIHGTEADTKVFPNQRDVAVAWTEYLKEYLPEETFNKALAMVKAVPESTKLIHGDYHTNNVMVLNDDVLLIDMDTLAYGDIIFEFASIYNAFIGFSALNHNNIKDFLGIDYETGVKFYWKTLEKYFGTTDKGVLDAIDEKSRLMGSIRIMRRQIRRGGFDDPESKKIIEYHKNEIIKLTDKLDKITF